MKKRYLRHNLTSFMFSIFFFLFAVEPALEKINVIDYIVWSLIILCETIWLVSCIISIVKDKQNFILNLTSTSRFSFFNIASALIGLIISYSLNSNLIKLWIFLLVINIVSILIPRPFKQQ
jgi:hypothetical protein